MGQATGGIGAALSMGIKNGTLSGVENGTLREGARVADGVRVVIVWWSDVPGGRRVSWYGSPLTNSHRPCLGGMRWDLSRRSVPRELFRWQRSCRRS